MDLSRREFLTTLLPLLLLFFARRPSQAEGAGRRVARYHVDAGVFFGLFTFNLEGAIEEQIDRAAGRYHVVVAGRGSQIVNRMESLGVIRGGRFMPTATNVLLDLRGRESRTTIAYDHDRGLIDYNHVSHTFFLGRRREVHDLFRPHPGQPVDDLVTTALNYAEGAVERDATGSIRTYVVRRTRPESEGPDDVQLAGYRAEIVPLVLNVSEEPGGGREVGQLDLSRLSSWARRGAPVRITFGRDRRPDSIQAELILGTTVRITFRPAS